MPSPNAYRPVDVLDSDLASILKANVNAVTDAFIDDGGDTNAAGFGQRFQPRRDIDAVAVNIVALDDDIAEIDADAQHDRRWRAVGIRRQSGRALHRERAVHCIDHAAKLDNGAVANQFHNPPVVSGNGRVENDLAVPLQGGERAGLVGSHQAGIADHISSKDRRKLTVNAFLGHVFCENPTAHYDTFAT